MKKCKNAKNAKNAKYAKNEKINEETTPARYSDGSHYQPDKRAKNYNTFKFQNILMGTRSELWLKKKNSGD